MISPSRTWLEGFQTLDQMLLSPPMMTRRIFALNKGTMNVDIRVKHTVEIAKNIRNAKGPKQGAIVPAQNIAKTV
jgi:hypothetical protein